MSLFNRARNILLQPKAEWDVIAAEPPAAMMPLIISYVLPLALIPPLASVLKSTLFSEAHVQILDVMPSVTWSIVMAVISLVSTILGVIVSGYIVDALAPSFASQKNLGRSLQLIAYSATPMWVAGIFSLIPYLGVIGFLVGLYGLYLMYLGLPVLMGTPNDKRILYLIIAAICMVLTVIVISAVLSAIFLPVLGLSMLAG